MGATKSTTEPAAQAAQHVGDAGVEISFRIGQRLKHSEHCGKRVTGIVRGLQVDSDRGLMVHIVLDEPIVIPATAEYSACEIWHQTAPAHEFSPFDERDELVAELLSVARRCERQLTAEGWVTSGPRHALDPEAALLLDLRAAITKVTGAAS